MNRSTFIILYWLRGEREGKKGERERERGGGGREVERKREREFERNIRYKGREDDTTIKPV